MFSTDRRVIPVAHGVTFDEIAAYSPFLADRAGLTLGDGVADAAQVIADALAV